jgi:hypothetical protein
MSSMVHNGLVASRVASPSRRSSCSRTSGSMTVANGFRARLDGCCGLDGPRLCVATSETGHECGFGGAGLNETVVAAGMHNDVFGGRFV